MAHACTRYRGPSPPSHPDEQLCMDVSARQKLMLHAPKALLWGAMEAMIAVITYYRVRCAVKCCKVSETLSCPRPALALPPLLPCAQMHHPSLLLLQATSGDHAVEHLDQCENEDHICTLQPYAVALTVAQVGCTLP